MRVSVGFKPPLRVRWQVFVCQVAIEGAIEGACMVVRVFEVSLYV